MYANFFLLVYRSVAPLVVPIIWQHQRRRSMEMWFSTAQHNKTDDELNFYCIKSKFKLLLWHYDYMQSWNVNGKKTAEPACIMLKLIWPSTSFDIVEGSRGDIDKLHLCGSNQTIACIYLCCKPVNLYFRNAKQYNNEWVWSEWYRKWVQVYLICFACVCLLVMHGIVHWDIHLWTHTHHIAHIEWTNARVRVENREKEMGNCLGVRWSMVEQREKESTEKGERRQKNGGRTITQNFLVSIESIWYFYCFYPASIT